MSYPLDWTIYGLQSGGPVPPNRIVTVTTIIDAENKTESRRFARAVVTGEWCVTAWLTDKLRGPTRPNERREIMLGSLVPTHPVRFDINGTWSR